MYPVNPGGKNKRWRQAFPHSLHSRLLSVRTLLWWAYLKKTADTKGSPTYSTLKGNLSTVGRHILDKSRTVTRLSHVWHLLGYSPAWTCWCGLRPDCGHQPSLPGNTHGLGVQILTGWLSSVLLRKAFSCSLQSQGCTQVWHNMPLVKPFPTFPPLMEILPCVDHRSVIWSMWVLFMESMSWTLALVNLCSADCHLSHTTVFRAHLPGEILLVGNCHWASCVSEAFTVPCLPAVGIPWDSPSELTLEWGSHLYGWAEKRLYHLRLCFLIQQESDTHQDSSVMTAQKGFTHCAPVLLCPTVRRLVLDKPRAGQKFFWPSLWAKAFSRTWDLQLFTNKAGPFPSEEFLSTLLLLPLIKVYTEPEVSYVTHMLLYGRCPDGIPCGSARCKDVF